MSFPGRAPDPPGGPGMPGGYPYPSTPSEQLSGIQAVSGRTSPTLGADSGQRATGGLGPNSGPSADEALVGTVIDDRYVVEGVLGEGGMGVVYSARHSKLGRRYALKVLRRELADDPTWTARPALEAIVQKCLEKRPERRYQTCAELGNDLIRFLRGEVVAAFADLGAGGARANAPGDYFRTAAIPGVTGQKGGLPGE